MWASARIFGAASPAMTAIAIARADESAPPEQAMRVRGRAPVLWWVNCRQRCATEATIGWRLIEPGDIVGRLSGGRGTALDGVARIGR